MHDLILQAIKNCSEKYGAKDNILLWDERHTPQQKSQEIAKELSKMGYEITPKKEDYESNRPIQLH